MLFFTKNTCKKNKFLKKEICHKLDTVILQIKQGDHNSFFGEEIVRKWINELNDLKAMLDGCICTDKNDMGIVAEAISEDMKSITKVVHTTSPAKVEREIGILEKHVLIWKNVNDNGTNAKEITDTIKGDRSNRAVLEGLKELEKLEFDIVPRVRRWSDRETRNLNYLKEYEDQIKETTDIQIISVLFDEMTRLREQNNFVGRVLNSYKNIAELLSTIIASIESQIMSNACSEYEKECLLTWLNIDNINIDDYKSLETFLTELYNMICGLHEFINTDETDKEDTLCLIQERKGK